MKRCPTTNPIAGPSRAAHTNAVKCNTHRPNICVLELKLCPAARTHPERGHYPPEHGLVQQLIRLTRPGHVIARAAAAAVLHRLHAEIIRGLDLEDLTEAITAQRLPGHRVRWHQLEWHGARLPVEPLASRATDFRE